MGDPLANPFPPDVEAFLARVSNGGFARRVSGTDVNEMIGLARMARDDCAVLWGHIGRHLKEIERLRGLLAQTLGAFEALHPANGELTDTETAAPWNATVEMLEKEVGA